MTMESKSTAIMAKEWDTVALDVAAGRCIVEEILHDDEGEEKRYLVTMILPRKNNVYDVVYPWFTSVNVEPEKEFTVTWLPRVLQIGKREFARLTLPPTVASAPASGSGAAGEGEVWQTNLSTYDMVHPLVSEGKIIDAIKTIRARYPNISIDNARNYCRAMRDGFIARPQSEVVELQAENAALRSQLAAVTAALKPFADTYKDYLTHCVEAKYDPNYVDFINEFVTPEFITAASNKAFITLYPAKREGDE